jgi:MFS family permease
MRATALAVYSSGVYIGSGIGIFLGGVILDGWANLYPDTSLAPWQLKGWHVAFFAVGIPGLLMSLWVVTLKEPQRGMSEGIVTAKREHPFRESWSELASLLPILNLIKLIRNGGGRRGVIINLVGLVVIGSTGFILYLLTDNLAQWLALGIGVYAAFCWAQNLAFADPVAFHMIFGSKTIMFAVIGFPSTAFITYGIGFWGPPFFQRIHEVSASEAGMVLGLSAAVGGWLGVTIGGVVTDRLRLVHIRAKFYVGMASIVLSVPLGIGLLVSDDLLWAYIFNFLFALTSPMWIGPAASTINDLVLPRMRAIASAFYLLMVTFIGLALGPYTIGFLSDTFVANGSTSAEALRSAMLWGLSMYLLAFIALYMASRFVASEEPSRLERARALGEDI